MEAAMMRAGSVIGGTVALAIVAGVAWAQHSGPTNMSTPRAGTEPYSIEAFGAFRDLILKGDFTSKVTLGTVMSRRPSVGVGAVSGARGEITIVDGKSIISYGKLEPQPAPTDETAALLGTATVKEWQGVRVDSDVAPPAVQAFLAQSAKARGLDPEKSFPFQVRGTVTPYVMHVNVAPTDGPHGMGLPMAITVQRKGDEIAGDVAGLYVSPALVGVLTHGSERVHAHWIAADSQSTAHLDLWGIKAGATLMLPMPE
jgi:hypothetical protein